MMTEIIFDNRYSWSEVAYRYVHPFARKLSRTRKNCTQLRIGILKRNMFFQYVILINLIFYLNKLFII